MRWRRHCSDAVSAGTKSLVVATGNRGKLAELGNLLEGLPVRVLGQQSLGVEPVEETGLTFIENAILKARHACAETGLPALADDSGLAVSALGGAPGIRSARFAGDAAGDADNIALLLERMRGCAGPAGRSAAFVCAIVFLRHERDPVPLLGFGEWHGQILEAPSGTGGFGYDPVFFVPEHGCSAAELPAGVKNGISHRARAMAAIAAALRREFETDD
jgi:XTP/dITP diphosphohydrolase